VEDFEEQKQAGNFNLLQYTIYSQSYWQT